MANTNLIIGSLVGTIGLGGIATGGYYGYQALNKEQKVVKDTIKDLLTTEGLTLFEMSDEGQWTTKFNTLRDDDSKIEKLKAALQEVKGTGFEVVKSKPNAEGGKELKAWCEAVFKLKKSEITGQKTLDNAKVLCAETKTKGK